MDEMIKTRQSRVVISSPKTSLETYALLKRQRDCRSPSFAARYLGVCNAEKGEKGCNSGMAAAYFALFQRIGKQLDSSVKERAVRCSRIR